MFEWKPSLVITPFHFMCDKTVRETLVRWTIRRNRTRRRDPKGRKVLDTFCRRGLFKTEVYHVRVRTALPTVSTKKFWLLETRVWQIQIYDEISIGTYLDGFLLINIYLSLSICIVASF